MALTKIALAVSVGDNGDGKQHGMCMEVISEKEWGLPFEKIVTPNHRPAYCFILLKPSMLLAARAACAPTYSNICDSQGLPIQKIQHASYVDFKQLGYYLNLPNLALEITFPRSKPLIIDGSGLGSWMFHRYETTGAVQFAHDFYTISSGPYTIGSGGNYATWALFSADIAATLTGDLTGTQVSSITETSASSISKALAGYTLTITSSNPLGKYNSGYLVSYNNNTNASGFLSITGTSASSGAKVITSNLNIKYIGSAPTAYVYLIKISSNTSNILHITNNCLLNANSSQVVSYYVTSSGSIVNVYNNIAANGTASGSTNTAGFYLANASASSVIENNLAYNFVNPGHNTTYVAGFGNYANVAVTLKNMVCFNNTNDYGYSASGLGIGNAIASKCASSDTSGSEASLRSLTAANELMSTDITSAQFGRPRPTGKCWNSGVAPSIAGNTTDIKGLPRPGTRLSTYSIGAHEQYQCFLRRGD